MKRAAARAAAALLTAALLCMLPACSPRPSPDTLVLKGSDTMLLLNRYWAEAFMVRHPDIRIEVRGGGTRSGIDALIAGEATIALGSRPIQPEEVQRIAEKYHTLGVSYLVARDAVAIYRHPDNPVSSLTLAELRGILTGRIRSWAELEGPDLPIRFVNRRSGSGSYRLVQERVLEGAAYGPAAADMETTTEVVAAVAADPAAIGYGGLAYADDVALFAIDGVVPTPATVADGSYPISRYLYLYTLRPPEGAVKRFVDWVTGPAGQGLVEELGYLPLWPRDPRP